MAYKEGVPHTFMGVENQPLNTADVVVLPVPYEGTTSYKGGTRFGPDMIIRASCYTETFDAELTSELIEHIKIHTAAALASNLSSPQAMVDDVYRAAHELIAMNKFLLVLGGEHSISTGIVRAMSEKYQELTVLQLDAHADLRDEFEGTKYNHACVMRRIREQNVNVVQVGIRSYSLEEYEYIQKNNVRHIFYAPFHLNTIKEIIAACTTAVYLTIDADAFDPSIMPATGTPVPGGLLWYDALELLRTLCAKRTVVGIDFVELANIGNTGTRSEDTAALLIYRLLGYRFRGHR